MVGHLLDVLHVDPKPMAGPGEDMHLVAPLCERLSEACDVGRRGAAGDRVERLPTKHADEERALAHDELLRYASMYAKLC